MCISVVSSVGSVYQCSKWCSARWVGNVYQCSKSVQLDGWVACISVVRVFS